jgi:hypothetical protein
MAGERPVSWGYQDLNMSSAELQTKLSSIHGNNFHANKLNLHWNNEVVLVPMLFQVNYYTNEVLEFLIAVVMEGSIFCDIIPCKFTGKFCRWDVLLSTLTI